MTDPLFDLSGRVAVVTGSSGQLGRTLCAALAERGAAVVGLDLAGADELHALWRSAPASASRTSS